MSSYTKASVPVEGDFSTSKNFDEVTGFSNTSKYTAIYKTSSFARLYDYEASEG